MALSQLTRWDDVGSTPGAGLAKYVAGDQPISEYDNWFNWSAAKDVENLIAALENITTGHDHDGANSKQVDGSDVVNTPAGNVAATDVQAAINELDTEKSLIANITDMDEQSFTDLLENGDFEPWSLGAAAAPDGWVSDAGTIEKETTIIKHGVSSVKITNAGSYARISQTILNHSTYANKTITLQAWVKSTLSTAAIDIRDSGGHAFTYHSGSGNWELLKKTIAVGATPSTLTVEMWIPSGTGDVAYFDAAILVEGSVCPAFSPKPITNSDLKFRDIASVAVNTTLSDSHYTVGVDASGAARTITLPAAASNTGRIYNISKRDSSANTVTIDANAAELINGAATVVISTQYGSYTIQSDGTGWWII